MFANVPGVPAAPPASGLVAAAVRPDPNSPQWEKWELGFSWVSERCGAGWQLTPWCGEPDPGSYEPQRAGANHYRPVEARFADECSTLNGPYDDERFRRLVEATTPHVVAAELWGGAGTLADPYRAPGDVTDVSNPHLASPAADEVAGSGPLGPVDAVGLIEQEAMALARGQQVYLHVPVRVLGRLHDTFRHVGSQLITHAGNVLVADPAYTGSGPNGEPAGTSVWCYATTPVLVLTSPIDMYGPDAGRVDRATNTRTAWASRAIAAAFDPCVHLATEITL